ncbi:MAG: type III-B CRISPR module RAMP protein Cmr4 [Gammaproteobacteria bacterium]|nr:type III-B CRISPR module RAMP protein Cmr4 [Gammaproteobacteria bacterium]
MNRKNAILGLLAQTSIHAGTGQNTGVIDLPIQREGHNGWPCVFGSAVKGALRTRAAEQESKMLVEVYGPEGKDAHKHAGAIAVSDARLLLFPVRSLTSQFKWVTCPAAIRRYQQDADRFGIPVNIAKDFEITDSEEKLRAKTPGSAGALFLEEYRFEAEAAGLKSLIKILCQLMGEDAKNNLEKQLVIVSDDSFAHLVQHATPVNAHISIDSETKTVGDGALWYEETLPPETLLYAGLSAVNARNGTLDAEAVLAQVMNLFDKPWLQLGGNETVGMGWCAVKPIEASITA